MNTARIETLRRTIAQDPANEANIMRLGLALQRAGLDPNEAFNLLLATRENAKTSAEEALKAVKSRAAAARTKLYRKLREANGAPIVCGTCSGTGEVAPATTNWSPGADWRMNESYPCPTCVTETKMNSMGMPVAVKRLTAEELRDKGEHVKLKYCAIDHKVSSDMARRRFAAEIEAAEESALNARLALREVKKAALVNLGAVVVYESTRARAKYPVCRKDRFCGGDTCDKCERAGNRVEVGTAGQVIWESADGDKIGIKEESGTVFFTKADYCRTLNAWERLQGVDPATLAKEKKEKEKAQAAESDAESIRRIFGTSKPERGTKVTLKGTVGKVFWTGPCKRTGRLKVGIKARITNRSDPATWGYASECVPV